MQGGGPNPRARVLLQPLHLAAEPLVHPEAGAARADPVQRLQPYLFIRRAKLHEQHARVGQGPATPTFASGHGRSVTPAGRLAPRISPRTARQPYPAARGLVGSAV